MNVTAVAVMCRVGGHMGISSFFFFSSDNDGFVISPAESVGVLDEDGRNEGPGFESIGILCVGRTPYVVDPVDPTHVHHQSVPGRRQQQMRSIRQGRPGGGPCPRRSDCVPSELLGFGGVLTELPDGL